MMMDDREALILSWMNRALDAEEKIKFWQHQHALQHSLWQDKDEECERLRDALTELSVAELLDDDHPRLIAARQKALAVLKEYE